MHKALMTLFGVIAFALLPYAAFAQGQTTQFASATVFDALGQGGAGSLNEKVLPTGYHKFKPHARKGHAIVIADAVCDDWTKVLSLQHKLRELKAENEDRPAIKRRFDVELMKQAIAWVNDANHAAICRWATSRVVIGDHAMRGYEDKGHNLHAVEIIELVDKGKRVYAGVPR